MAINVDYRILEDATRNVNSSTTLTAGVPVSLNTSNEVILAADGVTTYGLSKLDKNAYRDETGGSPAGIYGSGKCSVAVNGIVTVSASTYTTSTGATATVQVYDVALSYYIFQYLYAKTGLISTDNSGTDRIGVCLKPPTASDATMQLFLTPSLI